MILSENYKMISTKKIRDNFSQAAVYYERCADIQSALADELLEQLFAGGWRHQSVLDIGCGTGWLLRNFKRHSPGSRFFGLDVSLEMARLTAAKMVNVSVADAISLPFKNKSFDLVLANAVYQWVFDLGQAFKEVQRVLQKRGYLMFNCFGSKTLRELRCCFGIEENPLPTEELLEKSLVRAGFSDIEFKTGLRNKYFDNLVDILGWLKYIGANRISSYQPLLTAKKLARASHFYYSNYRSNGKVYASFEIFQVKAVKAVDS